MAGIFHNLLHSNFEKKKNYHLILSTLRNYKFSSGFWYERKKNNLNDINKQQSVDIIIHRTACLIGKLKKKNFVINTKK